MPIKGTDLDTSGDQGPTHSEGVSTPTIKRGPDGKRVRDSYQAIGGQRDIGEKEVSRWERGGRNGKSGL